MFLELLSACKLGSFGGSLAPNSKGNIKCVSLNNQPFPGRQTFVNLYSNQPLYYPFTVSVHNVVEFAILLMINMLQYVFQIN